MLTGGGGGLVDKRFQELGDAGIDAVICDSTNALQAGRSPSGGGRCGSRPRSGCVSGSCRCRLFFKQCCAHAAGEVAQRLGGARAY